VGLVVSLDWIWVCDMDVGHSACIVHGHVVIWTICGCCWLLVRGVWVRYNRL